LWEPGVGCDIDIDAVRGDTTTPDGRGVPDWCGEKRKEMNAVRKIKTVDNVPGRSAKRVIDRRRGITRSNHSKTKKKEWDVGDLERMAECNIREGLRKSSG
jgi:hypothetical protein